MAYLHHQIRAAGLTDALVCIADATVDHLIAEFTQSTNPR
jgi:hypothetical protein